MSKRNVVCMLPILKWAISCVSPTWYRPGTVLVQFCVCTGPYRTSEWVKMLPSSGTHGPQKLICDGTNENICNNYKSQNLGIISCEFKHRNPVHNCALITIYNSQRRKCWLVRYEYPGPFTKWHPRALHTIGQTSCRLSHLHFFYRLPCRVDKSGRWHGKCSTFPS